MSTDRRPRLLWLGTYESDYPRTRVLQEGLRALGAEPLSCHAPVWELTRHKAGDFLSARRAPATLRRYAAAWAAVARAQRRIGEVDAVVAGYPAQLDAPWAWLAARARRVPLVVDAMISLSDTLGGDRARAGGAAVRALELVDRAAVRAGSLVMTDTQAHADWFRSQFGVPPERLAVVRVGAEEDRFPSAPPAPDGPVLFYGKLSPLHGVGTVLAAAREPGVPPVRLIGEGQLGTWLAAELARDAPAGVTHVPWVPYERLAGELAAATVALGVFGASAKAARVVPNKVYQAMAVGRPIVTADTPGVREVLTDERDALLVPAADPGALAAALRRLAADAELRARLGAAARDRYEEVGRPTVVARSLLDALGRR
jgi:glycosyltransferase involved in cell wall biosynthesis